MPATMPVDNNNTNNTNTLSATKLEKGRHQLHVTVQNRTNGLFVYGAGKWKGTFLRPVSCLQYKVPSVTRFIKSSSGSGLGDVSSLVRFIVRDSKT